MRVRVDGQLRFNRAPQIVQAALAGVGLAIVPVDRFAEYLTTCQLLPVLQDWWPTFAGHHLYYTSRRQLSAAFALLVEALRRQK